MALNIAKANPVKLPSDCCWEWVEVIEYIRKTSNTSSPTQVPLCEKYYGWGSVAARLEAIEWTKKNFEVENHTAMEALAGENAILWEELNLCRDKLKQLQNCATKEHMGHEVLEMEEMVDSQESYEYEDYEDYEDLDAGGSNKVELMEVASQENHEKEEANQENREGIMVGEVAEVLEKYELLYDVYNNVMIDPLAAAVDEIMFQSGSIGSC